MIRNNRVKRFLLKWNRLRIHLFELEGTSCDDQVSPGGVQHSRGKITEVDTPSRRNSTYIFLPQIAGSTSKLQNLCIFWQPKETIKNPIHPTIRIRTKALMDRHPGIQIG